MVGSMSSLTGRRRSTVPNQILGGVRPGPSLACKSSRRPFQIQLAAVPLARDLHANAGSTRNKRPEKGMHYEI